VFFFCRRSCCVLFSAGGLGCVLFSAGGLGCVLFSAGGLCCVLFSEGGLGCVLFSAGGLGIRITLMRIRVRLYHPDADPDADPDSDILFDADPDPTFSLIRIQILALKKRLKPLKKC
jgi:hypothetical protein